MARNINPKEESSEEKKTEASSIDNAVMSQILDKMNRMEDEVASLKEKNKMLEVIAGNAAIADYQAANKDITQKLAHFKVYNDKTIVGWRCTKNEVKKINGSYEEDIRTEVQYLDGSKEEINYNDFIRCHTIVKAKIVTIDHANKKATVSFPTGETVTVAINFLNA